MTEQYQTVTEIFQPSDLKDQLSEVEALVLALTKKAATQVEGREELHLTETLASLAMATDVLVKLNGVQIQRLDAFIDTSY